MAEESRGEVESVLAALGARVLARVGRERPVLGSPRYWSQLMMEWSMRDERLKVALFRLVDVLSSLRSSRAVAAHITEYLAPVARLIHPVAPHVLQCAELPVVRSIAAGTARFSVRQMARQFIPGETVRGACDVIAGLRRNRYAATVDLLGEFSLSDREGEEYERRYLEALSDLAAITGSEPPAPIIAGHRGEVTPRCVSVKLSALYPHVDVLNDQVACERVSERLFRIALKAMETESMLFVDAEDSARNIIIYECFERVFSESALQGFPYPGVVLQAYSRSSEERMARLIEFAKRRGSPIAVRLVKGAYWDHETILAKQGGLPSPLYGRKAESDASFERLARLVLDNRGHIFPAFGSHNVRSLSYACAYGAFVGATRNEFELQVLYGMADPIAAAFRDEGYLVRMYVPLGPLLPGMGYLVRRLLENTSNESFLRHTFFDGDDAGRLLAAPDSFGEARA